VGLDKLIHVTLYLFFTMFWSTGLKRQYKSKKIRKYAFQFSIVGGFLVGLILEILQAFFVETRYFDWQDLIANGIGCIFGVLMFKLIYQKTYQ
jgi:glycopeptide antibiotics resistance protein